MMPREPAYGMPQEGLKRCHHARLEPSEPDNLTDQHNVVGCQAHFIELLLCFIVDNVRRAGKLAGILGNLGEAAITFS